MTASKPDGGKRLDSWKEIAAFFGRDERTVNRWEKLGMPVHRLPGAKGRVYAYTEELSAWLAAPKNSGAAIEDRSAAEPDPVESPRLASISGGRNGAEPRSRAFGSPEPRSAEPRPSEKFRPEQVNPTFAGRHKRAIRLAAAVALGLGVLGVMLFPPRAGRGSKLAGHSINPRQGSTAKAVLASTTSHNPEAEQLYLKGRYYWSKRTPEDLNKALDYFMQAVVRDPNYPQAYVGLADCYNLMREYTLMPSSEAYPRALAAAKKAIELDDQSSEAHASFAFVSFFGMWDVTTGEQEFRRAIDLNPNNPAPHQWYANALLALHRLPEALSEIDRAQELDPASSAILADKGNILSVAGRRSEAFSLLKQMESRDPDFRSVHLYLQLIYAREHDYPNYVAELRKDALALRDDSALKVVNAAEKGLASGGPRAMLTAMAQEQEKLYTQQLTSPTTVAWTLASLGNKAETLRYLQAAYDQHDSSLLFVECYPEFDTLYGEPAYRDLLARMNLPVRN